MNSNQQISDFIYYYPQILGTTVCENIISYYNKDTFKGWKTSTFSNAYKNLGTSKVEMKEYWIGPKDMFYKTIQEGFEKAVNDYVSVNTKIKPQEYTQFRINCYETGGFMKEHIDNIQHIKNLTWEEKVLWYFNSLGIYKKESDKDITILSDVRKQLTKEKILEINSKLDKKYHIK